jgi:hypothetical protein
VGITLNLKNHGPPFGGKRVNVDSSGTWVKTSGVVR